jgi:hypothetical protein
MPHFLTLPTIIKKIEIYNANHTKQKKLKKKKKGNLIGVPSYNIIPNLKFTMGLDAIIISLLSSTQPKHPRVYYSALLSHATWVPLGTYATDQIQKLYYIIKLKTA